MPLVLNDFCVSDALNAKMLTQQLPDLTYKNFLVA
jgi:hypothetical protein